MKMTKKDQLLILQKTVNHILDKLTEYGDVEKLSIAEKGFYDYNRGYKNAIEDVVALLQGNPVYINIMSGKIK